MDGIRLRCQGKNARRYPRSQSRWNMLHIREWNRGRRVQANGRHVGKSGPEVRPDAALGAAMFCEVNFGGGGSLVELSAHWAMCPSHLSAFGWASHRALACLRLPPRPAARSPPRTAGSFRACRATDCAPAYAFQLPRGARRAPRGPARLASDPPFLRAARATLHRARRLRPLCHAPPLARRPYKFTTRTRLSGRKGMKN